MTSAYQEETLVQGAELFNWAERSARSGQRNGSRVTGVGIGQCYHSAGRNSYDGLIRITPDGTLHIHTGCGNLGTYSHTATSRVAAEILKYDWDNCVVVRGDSRRHLSWAPTQTGSNTSFTCTRTAYVAAMDALQKLKEIAAMDLGGAPEDYDIADESVFLVADPATRISFAAAAQRAIELGGRYAGEEAPEDIHDVTRMAVAGLAGTGLIGVAKDNLRHEGVAPAIASGFIEIELDLETGKFDIVEYVAVADCGTVLHPAGLATQIKGGTVMGLGMACAERHVYDRQSGLPANVGFHQVKPAVLPRCALHHAVGCRGHRRPTESRGGPRGRRADPGLRFRRGAVRDRRCARRTLLQSGTRLAGHDHQRRGRPGSVPPSTGGEHCLNARPPHRAASRPRGRRNRRAGARTAGRPRRCARPSAARRPRITRRSSSSTRAPPSRPRAR